MIKSTRNFSPGALTATICLLVTIVFLAQSGSSASALSSVDQEWRQKALQAAGDSANERVLTLQAVYAGHIDDVRMVLKDRWEAEPSDTLRLTDYAWALMMAEEYRHDDKISYGADIGKAIDAIEPYVERKTDYSTYKEYLAFKPTQDPMLWLLWGHYLARFCFDKPGASSAYNQALKYDPRLAEAYFERAQLVTNPYDPDYFKSHVTGALSSLSTAEAMQPQLHCLVLFQRAGIFITQQNYHEYAVDLSQYLNLWPNAPYASKLRSDLARFGKS